MAMEIFTKTILRVSFIVTCCLATLQLSAQRSDSLSVRSSVKLSGTITDASTGTALEGISVSVPGYSSAISDENGAFSIDAPASTATLTLSGEGFQTKEVAIKGRNEIAIKLHDAGFNTVYRRANLSSVEKPMSQVAQSVYSLNPTNKFQAAAETPEIYMQGKIPGLNLVRRSGMPGIGTFMTLRGINSLYATNQPLIVVDGMIFDMNDYGGSVITNYYANPIANIDIKDIDNITVVKDASSSFGSKGANGAIFITTSHAQELATRIHFAVTSGVNFSPSSLPVMNASDYRVYLSDVLKSAGYSDSDIQAQPYMKDDPSTPDYYRYHNNTDWQDKLFKNSVNQNYYLKVTGGDNIAKYSLSLGYLNQKGIVENTDFQRYSVRFNSDLNITPRLSGNTHLSFTYGNRNLIEEGLSGTTNPISLSLIKSPLLHTNEISDDGLQSPNLAGIDIFNISNPAQISEKMVAQNSNYQFFGSANVKYDIRKNLYASALFGITLDKIRENLFIPKYGVVPDTLYNALALSRMGAQLQRTFSMYTDTKIAYDKTFNAMHALSARAGFRFINNKSEEDYGLGANSATDELQTIGTGTTLLRRTGGQLGKWTWLNYYASVDYSFLHKYFLSVNVALDGSSRFGDETKDGVSLYNNRFGVFPSLAAGWLISSENFMSDLNFIDMMKLRASYGITGNDDIGNYSATQTYVSQNLLGMEGLILGNVANPALQWETVTKTNLGLDLAFLNERLTLSVDVFKNKTDNMLTYETVSTVAGGSKILTNNGAMENQGIELALSGRVLDNDFKLDLGASVASYRNKVTRLPYENMMTSYANASIMTSVGNPLAVFYGYKTNGVYATNEEASAFSRREANGSLTSFQGGDVRFVDRNGDFIIDESDKTVIGNPNPDFTGMFMTRLGWKRFVLDADITFTYGNDVYNYTRAQLESQSGFENQTQSVMNRWRTDGQVTNVPRTSYGDPSGNARFSDRWIEDGSYIRLRTLSITYSVPLKSERIKSVTVYGTGSNLVTISRYLGYDPEFSASNNVLLQGINTGLTPQYKSVMLGVRLGL
jgi:TonB-linked SusC/RagA family outer membrane protein